MIPGMKGLSISTVGILPFPYKLLTAFSCLSDTMMTVVLYFGIERLKVGSTNWAFSGIDTVIRHFLFF